MTYLLPSAALVAAGRCALAGPSSGLVARVRSDLSVAGELRGMWLGGDASTFEMLLTVMKLAKVEGVRLARVSGDENARPHYRATRPHVIFTPICEPLGYDFVNGLKRDPETRAVLAVSTCMGGCGVVAPFDHQLPGYPAPGQMREFLRTMAAFFETLRAKSGLGRG